MSKGSCFMGFRAHLIRGAQDIRRPASARRRLSSLFGVSRPPNQAGRPATAWIRQTGAPGMKKDGGPDGPPSFFKT